MKPVLKGLEPFIVPNTEFLILGSFPSLKSLEFGFYYMHPQNEFYKILAEIFCENVPVTIQERKDFLILHKISLFDMIKSCEREGSLDSNIKNVIINDVTPYFNKGIRIGCTGKKSFDLFQKYYSDEKAYYLPSPSPANRKFPKKEIYTEFLKKQ